MRYHEDRKIVRSKIGEDRVCVSTQILFRLSLSQKAIV
jgi:hypothetical protein